MLIIFTSSCDNSVEPTPSKISGETAINTKFENSKSTGFSFSQGGNISFPNSNNILPDIIVMVQTNEIGKIYGVFLSPPSGLKPTFNLIKEFNDTEIDSAQAFFSKLNEVPDSNYVYLAIHVKRNQIWAVKTNDNKFGEILITHTEAYADSSNPSSPTLYGEVTFKWRYQPNGSSNF